MLLVYYQISTSSTQIISTIVKSPTLIYKVIKMNDRKPTYKLVTLNGRKPYADGDRAQAVVVEHLQLVNTCQEDPSLIVVDIGAFVGNLHRKYNKNMKEK
ncbi:unnamed protein product [Rotaria magnacalcarata]|uniref:Uncharacterized protein n=1 Tax=Rotaria magnacalcarata TaxID=392030 RepID=A0A8S3HG30_9BILA|nr:unnamed protein product [Rotaria magnacalcarata]